MKNIRVVNSLDSKQIGKLLINQNDIPQDGFYHFEPGWILKKRADGSISRELVEISLVWSPDLKPKGRGNAKHFSKWSRKGNCPGCGVSCGANHQENCWARQQMLMHLKQKNEN